MRRAPCQCQEGIRHGEIKIATEQRLNNCLKDAERIQERISDAFTRAFSNHIDGSGRSSADLAPESMPCFGACCSEAFGERDPEAWGSD